MWNRGRLNNKGSMVVCGIASVCMLAYVVFSGIPDYRKSHRLVATSLPAVAQIVNVGHRSKSRELYADYTYEIKGVTYQGRESHYVGNPEDRGSLSIRYLPDEPDYSKPDPSRAASDAEMAVYFAVLAALVFGLLSAYFWGRVRRQAGF